MGQRKKVDEDEDETPSKSVAFEDLSADEKADSLKAELDALKLKLSKHINAF